MAHRRLLRATTSTPAPSITSHALRVIHGVADDSASQPTRSQVWMVGLGLFLLGILALPLDLPVARFCLAQRTPGVFRELLERGESYGHAYGVLLICITVGILSSVRWKGAWRLGAIALSGGIAADLIKTCLVRIRPCRIGPEITSVGETFLGFTYSQGAITWDTAYHSLPSAHTATAVALACGLGYLVPRGRGWFLTLAALTAAQRIEGGAHFVSDTAWGACVGWLIGNWASARLLPALFHRETSAPTLSTLSPEA